MIAHLRKRLENGPIDASALAVGGNLHVNIKVKIEEVDEVGMVCRVKGMMGGWSEPQLRPWSCIASISFE